MQTPTEMTSQCDANTNVLCYWHAGYLFSHSFDY